MRGPLVPCPGGPPLKKLQASRIEKTPNRSESIRPEDSLLRNPQNSAVFYFRADSFSSLRFAFSNPIPAKIFTSRPIPENF
jgi:hypothetical protein